MSSGFIIEEFTAVVRNTLRGFCRVRLPSGMVLHDVAVHMKNGKFWATPAGKPRLGRDDPPDDRSSDRQGAMVASRRIQNEADQRSVLRAGC